MKSWHTKKPNRPFSKCLALKGRHSKLFRLSWLSQQFWAATQLKEHALGELGVTPITCRHMIKMPYSNWDHFGPNWARPKAAVATNREAYFDNITWLNTATTKDFFLLKSLLKSPCYKLSSHNCWIEFRVWNVIFFSIFLKCGCYSCICINIKARARGNKGCSKVSIFEQKGLYFFT